MKIGIVGLIGLFAWNALFGAFGGVLLCIHQDLVMHLDDKGAARAVGAESEPVAELVAELPCATEHCQPKQTDGCLDTGECCIDIELPAELLPVVRFKSDVSSLEPLVLVAIFIDCLRAPEPTRSLFYQNLGPYAIAPPELPAPAWLTEFYLETTLLRV